MLGNGFRLGRLYGINIRVDWSWLFILILIVWNLTTVFGQFHPGWGAGLRWGLSLLAALLFFASVLAHEMAHSLVARAQGLPVRNITLFLFGGVSNIQREPTSPKNEFFMAAAGPFTSLVLGVIMLLVTAGSIAAVLRGGGSAGQLVARLSPAATLLFWLGSVNLILAIFNLIPGFPLDGGRVLRSIFWAITKNIRQATRWAAWIGQFIAWLMITGGIAMAFGFRLPFFGTGIINGVWLAFIGWFLNVASVQSYQQVAIQDILEGVKVERLMRRDPPTVDPSCTVAELLHTRMIGSDDHAFPVLDQGQLVGIVSIDDVRRVERDDWEYKRVRDVMTPRPSLVTVTPEEDASKAMETLVASDVRQLPVVDGNAQFLGLLRRRDIMRWLELNSKTGNHAQAG